MKTIYLIRHAKSDWSIEDIPDIDRPLNQKGYNDAHKMSSILKGKKITPDLVISSPAIRAITTALIFCRSLSYDQSSIMIAPELYDSEEKDYMKVIKKTENQHAIIFVFGHNNTITQCVNKLINSSTTVMSTCSIAGIRTPIKDWSKLAVDNNELVFFDYPKNHHE